MPYRSACQLCQLTGLNRNEILTLLGSGPAWIDTGKSTLMLSSRTQMNRQMLFPDEVLTRSLESGDDDRAVRKHRFQLSNWKREARYLLRQARALSIMLRHPAVPWRAKVAAGLAVGYFFSPIQLIPSFIPVIGQVDDVCVMLLAMKLARKWTPAEIVAECEGRAASPLILKPWKRVRTWKLQDPA